VEHTTYPPTDGPTLRALREDAGVTQDELAAQFVPPTTRQRLSRWERDGASFVEATAYRVALSAAVAVKVARVA